MPDDLGLDKPGWKFIYADDSSKELVAQIRKSASAKDPGLKLFKTTTGRRRIYLFAPPGSPEKLLVKAYLPAKIGKRLKYLVRNSRCRQEFDAAKKLAALGIPAVRAIAFGYRTSGLLPGEEVVVEPYLEGLKNFAELWKEAGEGQRRDLFIALGRLAALMHKGGVLQRDFKPDSLLVEAVGTDPRLILADLERIRFQRGPLPPKSRIDNLGKILQSFFRAEHCGEMETLLGEYSKASGMDFRSGELRQAAVLSGIRQAKKQAEERQSWAAKTNELIEKFEKDGMEIRLSRELGFKGPELDVGALVSKMNSGAINEINGKKLEIISSESALKVMEKYFYLRELRIKCRPVLLAVDSRGKKGIAGIEIDDAQPLSAFLKGLPKDQCERFIRGLGKFLFRIELLGIDFKSPAAESILVKAGAENFSFLLSSPDQLIFSPANSAGMIEPAHSGLVKEISHLDALTPAEIEQLIQSMDDDQNRLYGLS